MKFHFAEMMLQYFVAAFFILGTVAVVENGIQSKECTFTKSKQPSCLYFVMKEDLNHEHASHYCFNEFNGALTGIYNTYDEATEVMKRYYWWAHSKMDIPRIRFGMLNTFGSAFQYTMYNPLQNNGKDVDMVIWKRSFPATTEFDIGNSMRDETFAYHEPHVREGYPDTYEYMALKPTTMKWSQANFKEKIPFICEVPRFPKAYCEPGWWLHMKSRSCFFLNTNELKFQSAALACREKGSNLASINDETENKMALKMIHQINRNDIRVWFGLRHEASRAIQGAGPKDTHSLAYAKYFAEYLGYNVDGTPVSTFTYFGNHQPDGVMLHAHENCFLYEAEINDANNRWNDYPCDTTTAMSLCRKMSSSQPYHSS